MPLARTGRKRARTRATPVNCVREGDDPLVVASQEHS